MVSELYTSSGLQISGGLLWQYSGKGSNVVVPDIVNEIAEGVFIGCDGLESVELPEKLRVIGKRCFEGCTSLKSISLPSGLRKLGAYAFADCYDLESVTIPSSLSEIEPYVFRDCRSISEIEIHSGVREIGIGAFQNCANLKSIYIPRSVSSFQVVFSQHPFSGCDRLTIYTPSNSEAEQFATENSIAYEITDAAPSETYENPQVYNEKSALYNEAMSLYSEGTVESLRIAIDKMSSIYPFKDSQARVDEFYSALKREQKYNTALLYMEAGNDRSTDHAIDILTELGDYKDSAEKLRECIERFPGYAKDIVSSAGKKNNIFFTLELPGKSADTEKLDADALKAEIYDGRADYPIEDTEPLRTEKLKTAPSENEETEAREAAGIRSEAEAAARAKARQEEAERIRAKKEAEAAARAKARQEEAERVRAEKEARRAAAKRAKEEQKLRAREEALARDKEKARLKAEKEAHKKARAEEKLRKRTQTADEKHLSASAAPDTGSGGFPWKTVAKVAGLLVLVAAVAVGAATIATMNSAPSGTDEGSAAADSETGAAGITLEDFVNHNPSAEDQIRNSAEGTDVSIDISGNTLIYTYDLSGSEGLTIETVEDEEMIAALDQSLDSSEKRFMELCSGLESDTGISGIAVEVDYKFGDEIILSRTYNSNGKQK